MSALSESVNNFRIKREQERSAPEITPYTPPEPGFAEAFLGNLTSGLYGDFSGAVKGLGARVKAIDEIGRESSLDEDIRNGSKQTVLSDLGDYLVQTGQAGDKIVRRLNADYGTAPEYADKDMYGRLTSPGYLTNPRGLWAETWNGVGSSLPFISAALAGPEFTMPGRVVAAIGSKAEPIVNLLPGFGQKAASALLGSGAQHAANEMVKAGTLITPLDAFINSSEMYDELKEQGKSDREASAIMNEAALSEAPVDFLANAVFGGVVSGGIGNAIAGNGARIGRRALSGLSGIPLEMGTEYVQEALQQRNNNRYLGKPHGEGFDFTPEERAVGAAAALGSILPSAAGAVRTTFTVPNSLGETNTDEEGLESVFDTGHGDIDRYVSNAARRTGLPPQLIHKVIQQESSYNPDAVSDAGAQGLMQLMPGTASMLGVEDSFNPEQNINGGAEYLRQMLDMFDGDVRKALAAYNAGPGNIEAGYAYADEVLGREVNGTQQAVEGNRNNAWNPIEAASDFMGKRMDNGDRGCVEAVTKIGAAGGNPFLTDQLEKGVVGVPTLVENAGDMVIPFDASKLQAGDVIVYGDNAHVVLYDGNGGYVGNSSSQMKVIHGDDYTAMGEDLPPTRIIKTGGQGGSAPVQQGTTSNRQQEKPVDTYDDEVNSIYEGFIREQLKASQSQEDKDFFGGFFDKDGNFEATKENISKIEDRVANDLAEDFDKYVEAQETTGTRKPQKTSQPEQKPVDISTESLGKLREQLINAKSEAANNGNWERVQSISSTLATGNEQAIRQLAGKLLPVSQPENVIQNQPSTQQPAQQPNQQYNMKRLWRPDIVRGNGRDQYLAGTLQSSDLNDSYTPEQIQRLGEVAKSFNGRLADYRGNTVLEFDNEDDAKAFSDEMNRQTNEGNQEHSMFQQAQGTPVRQAQDNSAQNQVQPQSTAVQQQPISQQPQPIQTQPAMEQRDAKIIQDAYSTGMGEVSTKRSDRIKQGKGLVITANAAGVSLPAGMVDSLRKGNKEAIQKAQGIIRNAGVTAPAFGGTMPLSGQALSGLIGGEENEGTEGTKTESKETDNTANQNQNAESEQTEKEEVKGQKTTSQNDAETVKEDTRKETPSEEGKTSQNEPQDARGANEKKQGENNKTEESMREEPTTAEEIKSITFTFGEKIKESQYETVYTVEMDTKPSSEAAKRILKGTHGRWSGGKTLKFNSLEAANNFLTQMENDFGVKAIKQADKYNGFLKSMTPAAQARADKTLSKTERYNGKISSRGKIVEGIIESGGHAESRGNTYRIYTAKGTFVEVTKIEHDYAKFLEGLRTSDTQEETETDTNQTGKGQESKPNKETEDTTKEYKYYMNERGVSPGAQPKGFTRFDEEDKGGRYGAIYYDHPLTEKEIADYELTSANQDESQEKANEKHHREKPAQNEGNKKAADEGGKRLSSASSVPQNQKTSNQKPTGKHSETRGAFSVVHDSGKHLAKLESKAQKNLIEELSTLTKNMGGTANKEKKTFTFKDIEALNQFLDCANAYLSIADSETMAKLSITAWHGSPHKFDSFSLQSIGTGEGAQVHGWGLYFAGAREVSEGYREKLTEHGNFGHILIEAGNKTYTQHGSIFTDGTGKRADGAIGEALGALARTYKDGKANTDEAIQQLEQRQQDLHERAKKSPALADDFLEAAEEVKDAIKLLRDEGSSWNIKSEIEGSLFQVEIPDEDVMLDEQKKLIKQSDKVWTSIQAISDFLSEETGEKVDFEDLENLTGEEYYKEVKLYFREEKGKSESEAAKATSELFNEYGIKGITYEGGRDGRCYVVFDDQAIDIIGKFSANDEIRKILDGIKIVENEELNSQQEKFSALGSELGCQIVWIDADPRLNGMHIPGTNVTLLNRKAGMSLQKTFWHETFHWIKANNDPLWEELLTYFKGKTAFTKEQIDSYREKYGRYDLQRDEDVIEELLADAFVDVKQRVPLMQEMAKENPSLAKKFVAWLKRMMDRFVEVFHNPEGKLTTAQRDQFVEAFGRLAASMVDGNKKKLFKTYNNGKRITFLDGEPLPELQFSRRSRFSAFDVDFDEIKDVRKKYEGTGQWMKAPNGKKTNLTEAQWLAVRTKAFKKWFGDWENNPDSASKIIDENGEPMPVTHGTNEFFSRFDKGRIGSNTGNYGHLGYGFYFSTDVDEASGYGNNTMSLFLNIRKPFEGDEQSLEKYSDILDLGETDTVLDRDSIKKALKQKSSIAYQFVKNLEKGGYEEAWERAWDNEEVQHDEELQELLDDVARYWDRAGSETYTEEDIERISKVFGKNITSHKRLHISPLPYLLNTGAYKDQTEAFTKALQTDGYDGVIYGSEVVAFEPKQIKSATDNVGTFSTESDNIKYSFAGENAENAPLEDLERAKKMDGKSSPTEIYKKTGWFKGQDGKWRFEIPDNLNKINFDRLEKSKAGSMYYTLGEIYDNPKLYEAYPDLIRVLVGKEEGMGTVNGQVRYDEGEPIIVLNADKLNQPSMKTTLIHEIQHVIQQKEGFAAGGSPKSVRYQIRERIHDILKKLRKLDNANELIGRYQAMNKAFFDYIENPDVDKEMEMRRESDRLADEYELFAATLPKKLSEEVIGLWNQKQNLMDALENGSDFELYRNLGGEQEAREVARRSEGATRLSKQNSDTQEAEKALNDALENATENQVKAYRNREKLDKEIRKQGGRPSEEQLEKMESYDKAMGEALSEAYDNYLWERDTADEMKEEMGTPTPHDVNALIVFGGKEFAMSNENNVDNSENVGDNTSKRNRIVDAEVREDAEEAYNEAIKKFPTITDNKEVARLVREGIQQTLDFGRNPETDIIRGSVDEGELSGRRDATGDTGLLGGKPGDSRLTKESKRGKIYGLGITRQLVNDGAVSLVGQKAESIEKLAEIAQVLRHPGYEKFHTVYVDGRGKVKYHETVSCRLPAISSVLMPEDSRKNGKHHLDNFVDRVNENVKKYKAKKVYYIHNHPSGNPQPSKDDLAITTNLLKKTPFAGHIILDHDEFTAIDANGKHQLHQIPQGTIFSYDIQEKENPAIGKRVTANDIRHIVNLAASDAETTAFFLTTQMTVRSVQKIHDRFAELSEEKQLRYLRHCARAVGGNNVIIATSNYDLFRKYTSIVNYAGEAVLDVVYVENGRAGRNGITPDKKPQKKWFGENIVVPEAKRVLEDNENYTNNQGHSSKSASSMPKFSYSSSDNSTPSLTQRIRNILSGVPNNDQAKEMYRKTMATMLEDALGVKIKYGKTEFPQGETVIYKEKDKTIRSKHAYDWENILPVAGGLIAERLGISSRAKDTTPEMRNYIADWILTGAANNTSPEAKQFQKAMANHPAYADKLIGLRTKFQDWADKTAKEQMEQSVQWSKEKSLTWKERKDLLYEQFIEELAPVENLVKNFEKATGKKLEDIVNPMTAFRLFRGSYGRAITMIEGIGDSAVDGLRMNFPGVDFTGFKTLRTILADIGALQKPEKQKDFGTYCIACHILDMHRKNQKNRLEQEKLEYQVAGLKEQIKEDTQKRKDMMKKLALYQGEMSELRKLERRIESNKNKVSEYEKRIESLEESIYETPDDFTEENCKMYIREGKDKYDEAQKALVRFSNVTAAILANSGVISEKHYNDLLKKWPNYVPLFRVFEENENIDFGDSMKKLAGSTRDIINPIESIIHNTVDFIKKAEKNKAKCLLADLARCEGSGWLIEEVDNSKPNTKTTVTFYENGVRKYLETDPAIVEAINNMDRSNSNTLMKFIHAITAMARACFTIASPEFAVRNVFRDYADMTVYNKYGFVSPADWIRGLIHAINRDSTYYEWLSSGAAMASAVSLDRNYTQEMVEKLTRTMKGRAFHGAKDIAFGMWTATGHASPLKGAGQSFRGAKELGGVILEVLQKGGEYSEYATRISMYEKAKKAMRKEQKADIQAAIVTAALQSRDLMDFSRHGKAGEMWNKWVPFANASLQGMNKFYRTILDPQLWKEDRKQATWAVARLMLSSVLPAMVLFLAHHDDDWYKEAPDWLKETHWLFKIGDTVIRIPKGSDVGIRFISNVVEKGMAEAYGEDKYKFQEYFKPLMDAVPDLFPIILKPMTEAMLNKSFFTKRNIVPQYQEKLPEKLQYGPYTTGLSKFIGEKLGIAPSKIDHVIAGYTGSMGMAFPKVIDLAMGTQQLDIAPTELPLTRSITYMPYKNPRSVQKFYEMLDEQTKYENEYKLTKKRPEELNPALLERLKATKKHMTKLSKEEKDVINNPNLTLEQRKKRQMDIQQKRINLVKQVVK